MMSQVEREIESQPEGWRLAADLAMTPAAGRVLPRAGERVAVVGCGTSWFVAQCYAALREAAGHGETDAFAASEFPAGRTNDRVMAITRSGTTTEILDLLRRLPPTVPTGALTGDGSSPVMLAAQYPMALPFASEAAIVQTRFATSVLALIRAHLGEDLTDVIADGVRALTDGLPLDPAGIGQVTFLGTGWTTGLANEAALKCRETALVWSESYPAMEYRHGPIAIAAPGRAVWVFGRIPAGLAHDIGRTRAALVSTELDPLADLIRAQRFAIACAARLALDPDRPRHLTRSVVLP
jgi:fructoselysine-6-P-deglycase FrlB-like protein